VPLRRRYTKTQNKFRATKLAVNLCWYNERNLKDKIMAKKWTFEIEERFTELRLKKLNGKLTVKEESELSKIRNTISTVEDETAESALKKLESNQVIIDEALKISKQKKEDLVKLRNQQALLIADTKRWIEEFDERYFLIQDSFSRLAKQSIGV